MTPASIELNFSPKRVSLFLVVSWIVLIVVTLLTGSPWLAVTSIFLGGALPFALLAIWFPRSKFGKFIQAAGTVGQLRIFGVTLLFAYSVYAQKWAGDVVNELFQNDARYFGITTTVLAVLFAPFGLVYRQDVIGWLWAAFFLVGGLATYVLPLSLLGPKGFWFYVKTFIASLLLVFVGAFVLRMSENLAREFKPLVVQFAVWADFNERHLCTDDWTAAANSVVFLGDQRVLVHFPGNLAGEQFSVKSCNFAKPLRFAPVGGAQHPGPVTSPSSP